MEPTNDRRNWIRWDRFDVSQALFEAMKPGEPWEQLAKLDKVAENYRKQQEK